MCVQGLIFMRKPEPLPATAPAAGFGLYATKQCLQV